MSRLDMYKIVSPSLGLHSAPRLGEPWLLGTESAIAEQSMYKYWKEQGQPDMKTALIWNVANGHRGFPAPEERTYPSKISSLQRLNLCRKKRGSCLLYSFSYCSAIEYIQSCIAEHCPPSSSSPTSTRPNAVLRNRPRSPRKLRSGKPVVSQ